MPDGYKEPVLVMSTDGVGTKVLVAAAPACTTPSARISSITASTTSSCTARRPLAFLDYIADRESRSRGCGGESCHGRRAGLPGARDDAGGRRDGAAARSVSSRGTTIWPGRSSGVVEERRPLHGDRVAPGDAADRLSRRPACTPTATRSPGKIVFEHAAARASTIRFPRSAKRWRRCCSPSIAATPRR